jgi:hypothetical protein
MIPHVHFGSVGTAAQPATQPEPVDFSGVPSQDREPLPLDLPDELEAVVPEFRSRRKAELLPPLQAPAPSKTLDPSWCKRLAWADWQAGFRWGVAATVGGLCLFAALAVQVLK